MEAWIISQIDKIDLYYNNKFHRKRENEKLSNHKSIKNKHPEDIIKPSKVLKIILGRYFSYRNNHNRNKKYSKLKDGADLLSNLNASELKTKFPDFNKLILKINANN